MDNIYRDKKRTEFPGADTEFAPEISPCPGMPEYEAPDRDFPSVLPERSELPHHPLSRDELDMIPQQDEI